MGIASRRACFFIGLLARRGHKPYFLAPVQTSRPFAVAPSPSHFLSFTSLSFFLTPQGGGHRCSEPGCLKVGRGRLRRCRGHTPSSSSSSSSSTAASAPAAAAAVVMSTNTNSASLHAEVSTTAIAPESSFAPNSNEAFAMQPAVPDSLLTATPPLLPPQWQHTDELVVMPPGAGGRETLSV